MIEASEKTKLIRATVLDIMQGVTEPTPSSTIIDAVIAKIDSGDVRGLNIAYRHEVTSAMLALAKTGKIARHVSGETEPTRSRYRDGFTRAARGSVTWSQAGER